MQAQRLATRWLRYLAVEQGVSAHTLSNYRRDVQRYLRWLEAQGIEDLSEVHTPLLQRYVAFLRQGDTELGARPLAPSSVARALIVVRGLHKFAVEEGVLANNVAADVAPPRGGQHLPETLSIDQVQCLLESIPAGESATPVDLRDRALLELLYGTGMRISEALALNVDELRDCGDLLKVTGKGRKQRIVPLGSKAKAALQAYLVRGRPALATGTSHAAFLNTRGRALSRNSAWHVLKHAAERSGLDQGISPHTLRHSYASHLIEGGADVRVVQELLGHASVTTTQIYTHISAENLRSVWASSHPRA
ncbi:site-specific tyrosine recombinase XerD [Corynebacterium gerontici]|uniref:Tyrosine recombinase XerD n=1 Tax=Corynebacterium gerontici TaxID=2079234 RepID=A0A3G6IZZ3_9CORY|nr:site-specific tyrosine recombinase XerD [Corynebacterium gerontici]AZA11361.1 Tyrosine recombinase XerD [Corynebacterium gerontici]